MKDLSDLRPLLRSEVAPHVGLVATEEQDLLRKVLGQGYRRFWDLKR
jgi:hypothetical protein